MNILRLITMRIILTTLSLVFVVLNFEVHIAYAGVTCGELELDYFENEDPGFRFVPGETLVYESGYFEGLPRLEEVYLIIRKSNLKNLNKIADVLAHGQGGISSESIYQILQDRVENSSSREVRIPLSTLLNGKTSALTNTRAACDGPNCYNATLQWYKPQTKVEHTTESKIIDYVRNNFVKLEKGSELQFGDLIMIGEFNGLSHTAIYLNDNLIWHKGSSKLHSPYTFETWDSAISVYTQRWRNRKDVKVVIYRKKGGIEVARQETKVKPAPRPSKEETIKPKESPSVSLYNHIESLIYKENFDQIALEIMSFKRDPYQQNQMINNLTKQKIPTQDLQKVLQVISDKLYPPENMKTE